MILTNLSLIKAVSRGDPNIQALNTSDPEVEIALEHASNTVSESQFGVDAKIAQTYFAAHTLSMMLTDNAGKGSIATEQVGDVSVGYTVPYLNQNVVLGATQYGMKYQELRSRHIVPAMVVQAAL